MILFQATAFSENSEENQVTIELEKEQNSRIIKLKTNYGPMWKIECESASLNFKLLLGSHFSNYACLALCGVTAAATIIDCYWKHGYSGNWNDFDKCLKDKSIIVGTAVLTCIIKCFP